MSVDLPDIVKKEHLTYAWKYRAEAGNSTAIVARYDQTDKAKKGKKWFHQYHLQGDGEWEEGAPTPSPIFGVDTLPKRHCEQTVYIFEGEKCAQAAHYLELPALTSMRGANQAQHADWAILAQYRYLKQFVLVPDNDEAGKSYMDAVYQEIKKACPEAIIRVCSLPLDDKGDDFVDWIKQHSYCQPDWNGFAPIDEPFSRYLRSAFESYVEKNCIAKGSEEVYKHNYKDSINKNGLGKSLNAPCLQIEEPPKEPIERRYKSEDSTIEKLGELLVKNPQGLLVYRDELKGWLLSFDKPGRENDRQFFLESWSGKEDFNVDRIGRGELYIPALFLSIFGSIQPGPLAHYVRSAIKGGLGDDGLIQRFQVIVWPDMPPDWVLVKGEASMVALEAPVHEIFQCLNQLQFNDEEQPILLPFTEEAQAHFDKWQEQHERRLRKGDLPPHMESHLAKYKKLLAALCLSLEHQHCAIDRQYPKAISKQRLEDALLWLDYFESHAKRIYGSSANAVPEAAKNLIQRIQKGEIKEPFSIRDVYYKHHWSGLSTAEEVQEVVDYLEEKQYLIGKSIKTAGRPMIKYWAHPQILDLSA